jgi:hypothetical protein
LRRAKAGGGVIRIPIELGLRVGQRSFGEKNQNKREGETPGEGLKYWL